MDLNLGEWLVIGLCGFLFVWYLGWNIFNRRRGIATYYWLRKFLSNIGEISQAGWLGSSSSGARLGVAHGRRPFRQAEATYWLESRELIPLWIIHLLQEKHELVQVQFSLQPIPKNPFDVGRCDDRYFDRLMAQKGYTMGSESLAEEYLLAYPSGETPPDTKTIKDFLEANRGAIQRISLRKESPQLLLQVKVKPLLVLSPDTFFTSIQSLLNSFEK